MTQRSCGFTLDLFEASRCEQSDSPLEVETYREPALLAPSAVFRHPRATRELMLGTVQVAYNVRRGKRRTIGFTVGPEGLAVSAPPWVSLRDIDQAVQDKSRWVLKKLQETHAKSQRLARAQTMWADGCQLLFLGRPVTVALDMRESVGASGALLEPGGEGAPYELADACNRQDRERRQDVVGGETEQVDALAGDDEEDR